MEDSFSELIVPKKAGALAKMVRPLVLALIIISGIFMLVTFSPVFMIAFIIFIVLWYVLVPRMSVEYEYSYVNGDLDIAAVYSKQSRKHLATIQTSGTECIAPVGSHELDSYGDTFKVVDYSSRDPEVKTYVIVKGDSREKILVHLDDKMLEDLKWRLPRKVFTE
ncbi:MAG: DUF6106 family protein [Chordicoccus sp.]